LRRGKEDDIDAIQKNIDNSLKINNNDLINPGDMAIRNSLFFRIHVSGLIESANVYNNINLFTAHSFMTETPFIANTILYTEMIGKKKMVRFQDRVNSLVKVKALMITLCGICHSNVVSEV
jgi:hypothetical protein